MPLNSAYLRGIGLVSSHGEGLPALTAGLRAARSKPVAISQASWPVPPNGRSLGFYIQPDRRGPAVREILVERLLLAFREAVAGLGVAELGELQENSLVIFASTKGCVEDYIWHPSPERLAADPFTPVLEGFLARSGWRAAAAFTVSNACASSHSALHLARLRVESGAFSSALVIAADFLGPFILQGFHSLHALSPTQMRPFAADRDGLLIGEAAGVALFSAKPGPLRLAGSAVDVEGFAATRPEESGSSLQRAIRAALGGATPTAVICHGTATPANDAVEDSALTATLPAGIWVTGTKGSLGHCLGAAGLVDLAAAAAALRENRLFPFANGENPDPACSSRLLTPAVWRAQAPAAGKSLLVTALGFGGVHSAFWLEKDPCS